MDKNKKISQKNFKLLLLINTFKASIVLSIPTINHYWEALGISLSKIGILEGCFGIFCVLLEFPSGVVADKLGRAKILRIGMLSWMLASITYVFATGFMSLLFGEVFFAIAVSFFSGAEEALLYDSLKSDDRTDEFSTLFSKLRTRFLGMAVFFSIVGPYLHEINIRLPFITMSFLFLVGFGLSLRLNEADHFEKNKMAVSIKNVIKKPIVVWIIACWSIIFACNHSMVWIYQPYLESFNFPVHRNGYIFALLNLFCAFSTKMSPTLIKKFSISIILPALGVISSIGMVGMSLVIGIHGVPFLFFHQFTRGVGQIAVSENLQKEFHSSQRASLTSLQQLVSRCVYAPALFLICYSGEKYGISLMLMCTGITLITISLLMRVAYSNFYRKVRQVK